jgi:spore coat protein H
LRSGEIDKDKVAKDVPNSEVNTYRSRYLNLVDLVQSYGGKRAYIELSSVLDMTGYMRWLSMNYIVRNGDYTDEIYYYIKPGTEPPQYGVLPWDYDDIFMKEPHEGAEEKKRVLGRKLLFSSEDPLDREIGKSAYIYDRYLDQLESTLDILSADFMRATMDQIQTELIPYLSDPAIIEVHKEDYYGGSDVDAMTEHMGKIYNYLVERNVIIRRRIEVSRAE